MRILIVDSNPDRQKKFMNNISKLPFACEVSIVNTSKAAINLLKKFEYNVVCLEYDLGESQLTVQGRVKTINNGNGGEVSQWLKRNSKSQLTVYLHTLNTVWQRKMQQDLPEAIIKPFNDDWTFECEYSQNV